MGFPANALGRTAAAPLAVALLLVLAGCEKPPVTKPESSSKAISVEEARAIAKEAYIYGFPMVDSYRIQYSYFVDTNSPEYKGGWNQVHNSARVYTPDDKAVQTPNSDTPYSQLGADLRAEPLVVTVPAVENTRYYSLQFIDLYTHNFAYVGSRATGSDSGSFLLAGPGWQGEAPPGIKRVIRSETEFVLVFYRTQLLGPEDIENVKEVQSGYKVETLSQFLKTASPAAPAKVDFVAPLTPEQQKRSPEVFRILNFVLQFCPTNPGETELMARFAKLGIGAGKPFDANALSPEMKKAIEDGVADAWATFAEHKIKYVDTGKESSADSFGTREHLKNNYLRRMSAAVLGIYGNSKEEAMYPAYFTDAAGEKLDASQRKYTLRFGPGALPPAKAFWSLTMYELPSSLLSANPLDRYLINSPMLPKLKRDADGGVTLYVQHDSPGKSQEANWLPAPKGPFFAVLRVYWPDAAVLDGTWKAPAMEQVK